MLPGDSRGAPEAVGAAGLRLGTTLRFMHVARRLVMPCDRRARAPLRAPRPLGCSPTSTHNCWQLSPPPGGTHSGRRGGKRRSRSARTRVVFHARCARATRRDATRTGAANAAQSAAREEGAKGEGQLGRGKIPPPSPPPLPRPPWALVGREEGGSGSGRKGTWCVGVAAPIGKQTGGKGQGARGGDAMEWDRR